MTKEHNFCAFNSRKSRESGLRSAETTLLLLLPIKKKSTILKIRKQKKPLPRFRASGENTIGCWLRIYVAAFRPARNNIGGYGIQLLTGLGKAADSIFRTAYHLPLQTHPDWPVQPVHPWAAVRPGVHVPLSGRLICAVVRDNPRRIGIP